MYIQLKGNHSLMGPAEELCHPGDSGAPAAEEGHRSIGSKSVAGIPRSLAASC